MLTERAQIAVEIEGTEGTAETLEGADVIRIENPKFSPSIEPHERNPARSSLSPEASVFGKRSARMTFDVELVGSGVAGDPLHFSDALRACGVAETLVAVTSATYLPASASIPSVTLAMYLDGKIYKMWGARGTASLKFVTGKPVIISFEFLGADFSETDGALLSSGVSYSTVTPPVWQNATFTLDSYAGTLSAMEINLGNTLALRPDANAASGHKSAIITARRPTLTLDPENVLVATEDYLGNWRSGTLMALSTAIGTGAGQVLTITAPKVQFQGVSMGEREGNSTLDINALLTANSGDDEWQIANT